jgi:5-methylcytosine-specific restriction enzyme A
MAKEFSKQFYKSKAWQECRAGYIQSVQGLCETCLEQGEIKPGYIVHHKVLLTPQNINDLEISLNWKLLKYECKQCHDKNDGHGVGNAGEVIREGLMFNEKGDVVKVEDLEFN